MKKSRFSESQVVEILKEGEAGVPVAEILRKHGISRNTYFAWKRRYAGGLGLGAQAASGALLFEVGLPARFASDPRKVWNKLTDRRILDV